MPRREHTSAGDDTVRLPAARGPVPPRGEHVSATADTVRLPAARPPAPQATQPIGTRPAGTRPAGNQPAGNQPAEQRTDPGKSAVRLVIAAGVLPVVALATGPILARTLGPDGRGYLGAVLASVALVPYLVTMGIGDAASYLVARRRQTPAVVSLALGLTGAVAGAVGAAGLWLLAPVLLDDYAPGVLLLQLVSLTLIPQLALNAVRGARAGEGRYNLLVAERWIAGLGRLVLFVALLVGGALTITTAAWAHVAALLAGALVLLVGLRPPRTTVRKVRAVGRVGSAYGLRAWGGELSGVLANRLDQVLMLPLAGATQLGYYLIAVSLAEVPKMLLGDLRGLLLSEVAARRDPRLAADACRVAVLAVSAPVAFLMAVTPFLVPLLFGEDFSPAVPMAEVLLLGALPASLVSLLSGGVSALGKPGLQSIAQTTSLVLVLVGIVALVPVFGAMGAAWAVLVANTVGLAVLVLLFRRLTGIGPMTLLVPRPSDVKVLVSRVRKRG